MPGQEQWVKGSDVAAAAAPAQIQSEVQELPYAMDVAIKNNNSKNK